MGGRTSHSMGGQRRTIICACGHTIQGHPTQLDTKIRLHKKFCSDYNDDLEAGFFDKNLAYKNGWGGVDGKNNKVNVTSLVIDGESTVRMGLKTALNLLHNQLNEDTSYNKE
jgi:hypothetical protein